MMIRALYVKAFTILALVHWASLSVAAIDDSSRAAARDLVNAGARDYKAGHFDAALVKFNDAMAIAEVPTVALWAAQANEKLGKLVAAQRLYTNALLMSKNELWVGTTQQDAQTKARKALQELEPRIPKLVVFFEGATQNPEIEVTIDNERIRSQALHTEFPLDPGQHVIIAKQASRLAKAIVTCAEGQKSTVTLKLAESDSAGASAASVAPAAQAQNPSAADSRAPRSDLVLSSPSEKGHTEPKGKAQRTAGWIVTGAGAAGVVIGIATGIAAGAKRSSLQRDGCVNNDCVGPQYKDRVDSYNTLRTVSGVGFVAGGVIAAAGVTLLLTSPKQESGGKLSLSITPGHIDFVGSY